ncbi:MAG: hypothetical protein HUU20_07375 [Pirellulales bacterium]|nr:hypothetical protein [Pirellulales bacterium]
MTLTHEHVIHRISNQSQNPDNTCVDTRLAAEELVFFRDAGGSAVCDVTPIGVGRDPLALQEVSRLSGVHVVSGLGLYEFSVWPESLRRMSAAELSDFLVREAEGARGDIPAGLLGEVSSHNEAHHAEWRRYRLSEEEKAVFRAVAQAQQRSGLAVSTHASLGRAGVAQLRCLIDAGADPERVVIGHCDAQTHEDIALDLDYYHAIWREGAYLQFDLFGWEQLAPDERRFQRVAALVREGAADRVLLSTDTCRRSQLRRYGGRGFDYLFARVLPGLRRAGVPDSAICRMTIANPARILARSPRADT